MSLERPFGLSMKGVPNSIDKVQSLCMQIGATLKRGAIFYKKLPKKFGSRRAGNRAHIVSVARYKPVVTIPMQAEAVVYPHFT